MTALTVQRGYDKIATFLGHSANGLDEVERRLDSIAERLRRAERQAQQLEAQVGDLYGPDSYELVRELHDKGRKHVYRIQGLPNVPQDWSLDLGEILYRLRSALDQAVNAAGLCHALRTGGAWADKAEFPVYWDRAEYANKGRKKIGTVDPHVLRVIEDAQPLRLLYPKRDWLWLTHDLNNIDKHRRIHILIISVDAAGYAIPYVSGHGYVEPLDWMKRKPIQNGDVVLRYTFPRPHPEIDLDPKLHIAPVIDYPEVGRHGLSSDLGGLVVQVAELTLKTVRADPWLRSWSPFVTTHRSPARHAKE